MSVIYNPVLRSFQRRSALTADPWSAAGAELDADAEVRTDPKGARYPRRPKHRGHRLERVGYSLLFLCGCALAGVLIWLQLPRHQELSSHQVWSMPAQQSTRQLRHP